jgi:dienelactone hydrolase
MSHRCLLGAAVLAIMASLPVGAADPPDWKTVLGREILVAGQTEREVEQFAEPRIPRMPAVRNVAEWEAYAARLRAAMFERVVYRGEAVAWRDAATRVEWLDTIAGGPGYGIKKLRYEVLPGVWIPAFLYEPERLAGKVPAVLNVNGHDPKGKAAPYKQVRCINQARRGMLALNVEWFGMGQLRSDGFKHARMNQLDLCGTSGLAPFYLNMKRGLDVLLAHPHADPERVAVTGLSGGGWQTIFISSLDTRVKLTDPVAGYSSFVTRIHHHKDLGDSEQTPCDMATVADYTHLTALMAPRPALLTYNAKDDCCFEAGYALPPLLQAARPVFKLYGREQGLRSHVNHEPGTHNYEKDNREALYRMLGDFFYPGKKDYPAQEVPCEKELKSAEELAVSLPSPNADFQSLALALSRQLPRKAQLPETAPAAAEWQRSRRARLREVVRVPDYAVKGEVVADAEHQGTRVRYWRLTMDQTWTVPVVELSRGKPAGTVLVVRDGGRRDAGAEVERWLAAGHRVLAVDPFYFGEAGIKTRGYLYALLIAAVGERPLGIQAGQVAAVARWVRREHGGGPVVLAATGPRSSTFCLVAAGVEEKAIGQVELAGALGRLKEVIEKNWGVDQTPELFCFGLLEEFDIKQLAALVAPRPVRFRQASPRVRAELDGLKSWYGVWKRDFEPLP